MNFQQANSRIIFEYISGSKLYGMSTEYSDTDVRGVYLLDKDSVFIDDYARQIEDKNNDRVVYEAKKFIDLLAENNPNIVEALFVPDRFVLYKNKTWEMIEELRDVFLSSKVRYTFSGYAISQLKRIRNHRKYLLNPPKVKPQRKYYGLDDHPNIPGDQLSMLLSINSEYINNDYKEEARKELSYKNALQEWNSYQEWAENRNEERKKLEAKFGFDTKHASHLYRLIEMARDLLEGKGLEFPLPYAESLSAIRNGGITFDQLEEYASTIDDDLNELYSKTKLQRSPDHKKIRELKISLNMLSLNGE
jgi:predicted nucleotidyltransferase